MTLDPTTPSQPTPDQPTPSRMTLGRMPLGRMPKGPRRLVIVLVILAVLVGGGFVARAAVHWINAKDYTPDSAALRSRLTTLESDPFLLALTATHHTTQSIQEDFECQSGATARDWNLRETLSGGLDQDAIEALFARSGDFGWAQTAPASFTKTIQPAVVVPLVIIIGDDDGLEIYANASAGLGCSKS